MDCIGEGSDKVDVGLKYLDYLHNKSGFGSPLHYPGGLPTSLVETGQQWDFPNAVSRIIYEIKLAYVE
jgi:hypothetical protein